MLTIAECRKLLGNSCPKSDAEVERLIDEVHGYINIFLDHYIENSFESKEPSPPEQGGATFTVSHGIEEL